MQKSKAKGFTLFDFKIYYKAIVIRMLWNCHKNTHRSVKKNRGKRNKSKHL